MVPVDDNNLIDITTLEQLNAIRYDLNGDGSPTAAGAAAYVAAFGTPSCAGSCEGYELMADLDFNNASSYASNEVNQGWSAGEAQEGWKPIGDAGSLSSRFIAIFDGNGYAISNLYVNRSELNAVGLFGVIGVYYNSISVKPDDQVGEIRNLGLEGGSVTGRNYVGSLVGSSLGGVIRACYATGSVEGGYFVGGLVGDGGGVISACYATGSVEGENYVGGLVGSHFGSTISACYATGNVSGRQNVGGFVGWSKSTETTNACYATGSVSGSRDVGGFIGRPISGHIVKASYFDVTTSGLTEGSNHAMGRTTIVLQAPTSASGIYELWGLDVNGNATTNTDDIVWDFGTSSDYPKLKVDFNGDGTATAAEFGQQHPTSNPGARSTVAGRIGAQDEAAGISIDFGGNDVKARVYPNPASNRVHVSGLERTDSYTYELYRLWGEQVNAGQLSEDYSIDLEGISVGTYVLILRSKNGEELRSRLIIK